jgi:hypothetical protein
VKLAAPTTFHAASQVSLLESIKKPPPPPPPPPLTTSLVCGLIVNSPSALTTPLCATRDRRGGSRCRASPSQTPSEMKSPPESWGLCALGIQTPKVLTPLPACPSITPPACPSITPPGVFCVSPLACPPCSTCDEKSPAAEAPSDSRECSPAARHDSIQFKFDPGDSI